MVLGSGKHKVLMCGASKSSCRGHNAKGTRVFMDVTIFLLLVLFCTGGILVGAGVALLNLFTELYFDESW